MTDLERFEEAINIITEIGNDYGEPYVIDRSKENYVRKIIQLVSKYNLNPNDFYSYGYSTLGLRTFTPFDFHITSKYSLTNSATHFIFNPNEDYILLENGNIGRLSFVNHHNYILTDELWADFNKKLIEYKPLDYDPYNFAYIYSMEDGIKLWHDFSDIYNEYQKRFDAVIRSEKIKKLQEELEKLEGEE